MGLQNSGYFLSESAPLSWNRLISLGSHTPTEISIVLGTADSPKPCWGQSYTLSHLQRNCEKAMCVQLPDKSVCFLVFLFCYSVFFPSIILSEISRNGAREERNKPFQVSTKKDFVFFFSWHSENLKTKRFKFIVVLSRGSGKTVPSCLQQWSVSRFVEYLCRPVELLRPRPMRPVQGRGGALPAWPGGAASASPLPGILGRPASLSADVFWGQGSSCPFKAWPLEPLHKWIQDVGSTTLLGSESHPMLHEKVRSWSLLFRGTYSSGPEAYCV